MCLLSSVKSVTEFRVQFVLNAQDDICITTATTALIIQPEFNRVCLTNHGWKHLAKVIRVAHSSVQVIVVTSMRCIRKTTEGKTARCAFDFSRIC